MPSRQYREVYETFKIDQLVERSAEVARTNGRGDERADLVALIDELGHRLQMLANCPSIRY